MIVAYIRSGLGNQLFQYAAARALSLKSKQMLMLRPAYKNDEANREYMLPKIGIDLPLCTGLKKILFLGLSMYKEKSFRYDPELENLKNVRLWGYWQSEKYFSDIKSTLQREIFHNVAFSPQSQNTAIEMLGYNCISLHVRRGDYVTNKDTQAFHGSCELSYYQNAVELWLKKKNPSKPHAFIFSDDPEWTQANLKLKIPTTYVTHNVNSNDHEDIWLMAQCKDHIIANSSFSWWGAWLNEASDSFIVAPKMWFKNETRQAQSQDNVPERWIRL